MSLSNLAKQKIVRMETHASFPFLIEITYFDESNHKITECYANCDDPIVFQDKTYEPMCFSVTPPSRDNTSISDGKLRLSTIDQNWILKIRQTHKRMTCTFIACIVYDDNNNVMTVEEIETMKFTLIKSNWDETNMTFTMMFDDRLNIIVPMDKANIVKVPALA